MTVDPFHQREVAAAVRALPEKALAGEGLHPATVLRRVLPETVRVFGWWSEPHPGTGSRRDPIVAWFGDAGATVVRVNRPDQEWSKTKFRREMLALSVARWPVCESLTELIEHYSILPGQEALQQWPLVIRGGFTWGLLHLLPSEQTEGEQVVLALGYPDEWAFVRGDETYGVQEAPVPIKRVRSRA